MGKRKTIVCLETGKQFNSVENAANAIGVSSGFISCRIKAGKPIKGFYYYYAGEMLQDEYRQKIRNKKSQTKIRARSSALRQANALRALVSFQGCSA